MPSPGPKLSFIAEDERGASWGLTFPDGSEAIIIFSKKGAFRGGHSHNVDEISLLLSGKAHYWKRTGDGQESEFDELPGEALFNKAGHPHLARFDEDSWLFDWRLGKPVVTHAYPTYRGRVERQH